MSFQTFIEHCHKTLSDRHRQYLRGRGVSDHAIDMFSIGTFPQNINVLFQHVDMKECAEKKIVYKDNFKLSSFFTRDLILPIYDSYGEKIIGLCGRATLSDEEMKSNKIAKYYNSNYEKSKNLFGLHIAKEEILKQDCVLLVEGNMDVVAAFDEGVNNVVASCGTALSDIQLAKLARYTKNIIILYDNDTAGVKATDRIFKKFSKWKDYFSLHRGYVPSGYKDLDDILRGSNNKKEVVADIINSAKGGLDYVL